MPKNGLAPASPMAPPAPGTPGFGYLPPGTPPPAVPPAPTTPVALDHDPTMVELLGTWRRLQMIELKKLLTAAEVSPAHTLTAHEFARLGAVYAQLEKVEKETPPANNESKAHWDRLTPLELEQARQAKETLRVDPGNTDAALVFMQLRAKVLGATPTAPEGTTS